jgi:ribosomal protein L40E
MMTITQTGNLMAEELTIYCAYCGAQNPISAETCASCKAELLRPHPILIDGGEIYTLHCMQCGQRLPVAEPQGYVTCAICGLSHAIVAGPGYLTVVPAPGINGSSTIEDFMAIEIRAANNMPPIPQNPQSTQYQAVPGMQLQWRINELQNNLMQRDKALKKRQNRRTTGTVLLLMGLVVVILDLIDAASNGTLGDVAGPVLFLIFTLVFIIGLILLLATGKRKDRTIESEIWNIQRELNQLSGQNRYPNQGVNR